MKARSHNHQDSCPRATQKAWQNRGCRLHLLARNACAFGILLSTLSACESSPPQVRTAVPISWGEANSLQLSPQTEAISQPWRKVVVLTRGVLTIGMQSNSNVGKVRLSVRNDTGRRSLFQKEIDLAPSSPVNITLNVEAGTYFVVVDPLQGQSFGASLAARFQPEDPDALSGADKGREGAQQLANSQGIFHRRH